MSTPFNDGGPAFPMQDPQSIHAIAAAAVIDIPGSETAERDRVYTLARAKAVGGMSLLAYFMAHAPENPQPWYLPVITPCPERPDVPMDLTEAEASELAAWRADGLELEDMEQERIRAYVLAFEEADAQIDLWRDYVKRETCLQWPRAWAEEQLRRLG